MCFILFWNFLDFSLAVSDHVVLRIGGNSGIHGIGVSIYDAEAQCFMLRFELLSMIFYVILLVVSETQKEKMIP